MPNQPTPKGAWIQMAMLFLYMVINFADKLVLQIAAVVTAHPTPTNGYPNNAFRVASSTDRPVSFAVLPIDLKAA